MIIPHLHFCGNCEEAIALYEKAFEKTPYSELVGNFADKFGIWWGFMVEDIK